MADASVLAGGGMTVADGAASSSQSDGREGGALGGRGSIKPTHQRFVFADPVAFR